MYPLWDQIKAFMRSISGVVHAQDKKIDDANGEIATIKKSITKPKKIKISRTNENSAFTMNISFSELTAMGMDDIAANTTLDDCGTLYSVRGVTKKTDSYMGVIIHMTADVQMGRYDIPQNYPQILELDIFGAGGKTMIGDMRASMLSNATGFGVPAIPVNSNGTWSSYRAPFEFDGGRNLVLPTMSENVVGGAKLGKNFKIEDDALEMNYGEFETIDSFTLQEDAQIDLDKEPGGKAYAFKRMRIEFETGASGVPAMGINAYCGDKIIGSVYGYAITADQNIFAFETKNDEGYWISFADHARGKGTVTYNYRFYTGPKYHRADRIDDYPNITRLTTSVIVPAGTIITIKAVRA